MNIKELKDYLLNFPASMEIPDNIKYIIKESYEKSISKKIEDTEKTFYDSNDEEDRYLYEQDIDDYEDYED